MKSIAKNEQKFKFKRSLSSEKFPVAFFVIGSMLDFSETMEKDIEQNDYKLSTDGSYIYSVTESYSNAWTTTSGSISSSVRSSNSSVSTRYAKIEHPAHYSNLDPSYPAPIPKTPPIATMPKRRQATGEKSDKFVKFEVMRKRRKAVIGAGIAALVCFLGVASLVYVKVRDANALSRKVPARVSLENTTVLRAQAFHRPAEKGTSPPEPGKFHNGTVLFLEQQPLMWNTNFVLCHLDLHVDFLVAVMACYMSTHWTAVGPVYDLSGKNISVNTFLANGTTMDSVVNAYKIPESDSKSGQVFTPVGHC